MEKIFQTNNENTLAKKDSEASGIVDEKSNSQSSDIANNIGKIASGNNSQKSVSNAEINDRQIGDNQKINKKSEHSRSDDFNRMMNKYKRVAAENKREARKHEYYRTPSEKIRESEKEARRRNKNRR